VRTDRPGSLRHALKVVLTTDDMPAFERALDDRVP